MLFGEYELSPSLIGLSLLPAAHPEAFQRLSVEVCVGVKGQSNLEIARTPRKAFRRCLGCFAQEVERPVGCEGFTAYQVLSNSECLRVKPWRKGAGANVRSREEKNPDRRLRSRSSA